MASLASNM